MIDFNAFCLKYIFYAEYIIDFHIKWVEKVLILNDNQL